MTSSICIQNSWRLAALLLLPVVGGCLYHIRGGWVSFPLLHPDNGFTHDLVPRVIWAAPTGIMFLLLSTRLSSIPLAIILMTQYFISLYVGWGTYLAIGTNPNSYMARPGVFDWLLGTGDESWTFHRRWVRECAGMALRGLFQTLLPGLAMQSYGYSSGRSLQISGTPLSEMLYGSYSWFILFLCLFSRKPNISDLCGWLPSSGAPPPLPAAWGHPKATITQRVVSAVFHHAWTIFTLIVFFWSLKFYMGIVQPDLVDKAEGIIGIASVAGFSALWYICSLIFGLYSAVTRSNRAEARDAIVRAILPRRLRCRGEPCRAGGCRRDYSNGITGPADEEDFDDFFSSPSLTGGFSYGRAPPRSEEDLFYARLASPLANGAEKVIKGHKLRQKSVLKSGSIQNRNYFVEDDESIDFSNEYTASRALLADTESVGESGLTKPTKIGDSGARPLFAVLLILFDLLHVALCVTTLVMIATPNFIARWMDRAFGVGNWD